MGELSDPPPTIESVHRALAALNRGVKQVFAEIGRFAHQVNQLIRGAAKPAPPTVPPHPYMVGSYDLECRYPRCGLGPEEH